MGLLPLEFSDCMTDSPYFRDNLHAHERELENTSQSIKSLTKDVKDLVIAAKNLSKAQKNFGQSLVNFKFDCIGNSQTDDEIIIAGSLKNIGNLILQIEDERDRILERASDNFIGPLENFRKENIGEAKEGKKKFDKETAKFCQSLERYLNLSSKKNFNQLQEADASLEMERINFYQTSLQYILTLQEVQERKKFEFVETILGFMYSWLTFYHQGHEVGNEFKSLMTDLQIRIQKTRDHFNETRDRATDLMKKNLEVRKTPNDPGSLCRMYARQGYLFLLEKKAFGTTWTKNFCQYQKDSKRFNMIPYSQSAGKFTTTDSVVIESCVRRSTDSIEKRFCFDLTVADRPGVLTFQALSEEDRRLWLDAMDGKEPTYTAPGKLTKQEESSLDEIGFSFVKKCFGYLEARGLEDQGMYRLVGVNSKVQKFLTTCLDTKPPEKLNFEDFLDLEIKTVTSAMKNYFRNLPEPVMTFRLYKNFISAAQQEKKSDRVDRIHGLIHELPQPNFDMIDLLIRHLCNIAKKSDINLMTVSNLGVCFGPTLLRPEEETMAAIMDIKFCNIVIEILVENYEKIFKSLPQNGFDYLSHTDGSRWSKLQKLNSRDDHPNKRSSPVNSNGSHAIVTSFMTDVPMSVQISGIPPPPSVVNRTNARQNSNAMPPAVDLQPTVPLRVRNNSTKQPLAFINPACQGDVPKSTILSSDSSSSSGSLNISSSNNASMSSLSSKISSSGRPSTFYQKSTRSDYLEPSQNMASIRHNIILSGVRVRTKFACVGINDTELSFEPNQIIEKVRPTCNSGWLEGTYCGKTGLFPGNYTDYKEVMERLESEAVVKLGSKH